MITLEDSIEIKAKPEDVFEWLTNLRDKESYQAWHPEHVDLIWIKGKPWEQDSIMYCEEHLHGKLHKLKLTCTKRIQNRLIEYRPLFPMSLLVPKNQFIIEPRGESGCIFTATGSIRIGLFFKKHIRNKIEATMQHIKEEGENLKKILENK